MSNRYKRAVGVFVVLCTMSFFALVSGPALAAPGPSDLSHPEDARGGDGDAGAGPAAAADHAAGDATGEFHEPLVISDVTTVLGPAGYPLRGVGLTNAKSYSWWDCKASFPAAMPTTPDCTRIASDTTPTSTVAPTGFLALNVFDGAYATIPTNAQFTGGGNDNAPRDIIGVACDAAGQEAAPTAANCTGDREGDATGGVGIGAPGAPDVHLDASASIGDHTGNPGPTDGGDIISPPNGSRVPNGTVGTFSLTAYTSSNLGGAGQDIDALAACGDDLGGTAATAPDNDTEDSGNCIDIYTLDAIPNNGAGCPGTEPAGMDCWFFPALTAPNNTNFGINIIEKDDGVVGGIDTGSDVTDSGNADCEGDTTDPIAGFPLADGGTTVAGAGNNGDDCTLDAILLTSGTVTPDAVHAHNDETNDGGGPNGADANDSGATFVQNANRKKTGNLATAAVDPLIGSVFSQFGDPDGDGNQDSAQSVATEATWELSGTGGATPTFTTTAGVSMCGGNGGGFGSSGIHDHDGNGTFEHCHFSGPSTPGAPNLYSADWVSATAGTVTATFCTDPEQDETGANHGCGNASGKLKDTVTKQVGANHAHLCQDLSGANPHNCPTTIVAAAASTVNLRAFFRGAGEQGLGARDITWNVNPLNDPNDPGQLQSRDEFTDAQGEAKASVTSPSNAGGKTSTIQVGDDLNGNGIIDAGGAIAAIQINWTGQGGTGSKCTAQRAAVRRAKNKVHKLQANDADEDKIRRARSKLRRKRTALRRCLNRA